MPPASDIPTDAKAAYEAGKKEGWEKGWQAGWKEGSKAGLDHKRSIIALEDEISLPLDYAGFTDDYEREVIGQLVRSPEYEQYFRTNMIRQVMMKHRQARMYEDPAKMKIMHTIGDHILDLVVFYDNAASQDQTIIKPMQTGGYDTVLPQD